MSRVASRGALRGGALATVLALALAVLSAFFAVRAGYWEAPPPAPPPAGGLFAPDGVADAQAVVARLCRGLLKRQQADGSYDPGEYTYEIERVAASAFATAALARVYEYGGIEVEGLEAGLARGLTFLKKKQIETGPIGYEEPKDHWSQVDATSAAILAFALGGREEDKAALAAAAKALKRFATAKLHNGWTRGLGVMTIHALMERGEDGVFGDGPKGALGLVDVRNLKQAPRDGPPQTSDWNVAEVISRVTLGLKKGVDAFPAQLVQAVLDEPAEWSYPSTDCAAWWMQAWLVARSGAPEAALWFETMREVLAEEAIGMDDAVRGGWYAHTVGQTSGAILAILEGLSSELLAR